MHKICRRHSRLKAKSICIFSSMENSFHFGVRAGIVSTEKNILVLLTHIIKSIRRAFVLLDRDKNEAVKNRLKIDSSLFAASGPNRYRRFSKMIDYVCITSN